jgi:serine/threonine protein kinase
MRFSASARAVRARSTKGETRLDRTVVQDPAEFRVDPQFRDRFDREARTISQLDHPRICALYEGRTDGTAFLVMQTGRGDAGASAEEGCTDSRGVTIAIQIADALVAAHQAGIGHRDLKPGNIMLTKSGATLLDFDRRDRAVESVAGVSMLPTTPPGLTAQGRFSARSSTWHPSSSKAKRPMRGPTSLRSARSSTRC